MIDQFLGVQVLAIQNKRDVVSPLPSSLTHEFFRLAESQRQLSAVYNCIKWNVNVS